MNKMVIFDLDGTLLDTIEDLTDSVNDVMQLYHFPQHDTKHLKIYVILLTMHLKPTDYQKEV